MELFLSLLPKGSRVYEMDPRIETICTTDTVDFFLDNSNWFIHSMDNFAIVFRLKNVEEFVAGVVNGADVVTIRDYCKGYGVLSFFNAFLYDVKIMQRCFFTGEIEIMSVSDELWFKDAGYICELLKNSPF